MLTTDGQIQIVRSDGTTLDLHQGTPYLVNGFNPFDRGVRADQGGPISWGDGDWSGAEWRSGATIPLAVEIAAADWPTLMQLYWALDAALAPVRTGNEIELRWRAGGVEYLMYGRPRGVSMRAHSLEHGTASVVAQIAAPDPSIYSGTEYTATAGLLRRSGGITVPFTLGGLAFYSIVADGEATIVNAGTTPARLLLRIDGPVQRPRITLIDGAGGRTLFLDTVLGAGEWMEIDTQKKLVTLNGTTNRLTDAYGDWLLLNGTGLIRFEADDYNTQARLTVTWRDTY